MTTKTSLVKSLFTEVLQTERSAIRHSDVEAARLGACAPAHALRAVSAHASAMEPSLHALAARRGVGNAPGTAAGKLLSAVRDRLIDHAVTAEQSYRTTLLGMRHGYDLISLFGEAARLEADDELAAWCDHWRAERGALVDAVAAALSWFALHPERALQNAKAKNRDSTEGMTQRA
jgi:hypothetical protein